MMAGYPAAQQEQSRKKLAELTAMARAVAECSQDYYWDSSYYLERLWQFDLDLYR